MSVLDPPVPVSAVFNIVGPTIDITFSCPLRPASLEKSNWFARKNNQSWTISGGVAGGSKVRLVTSGQVMDMGPDVVSYTPPPFDVLSLGGLVRAEAIVNYPLA